MPGTGALYRPVAGRETEGSGGPGEAEWRVPAASRGNAPQVRPEDRARLHRRINTKYTGTTPAPLAGHLLRGHNTKHGEGFSCEARRRGHPALAAHEALYGMPALEAGQRFLAPRCLRRRTRPLVRRLPGRLLPQLVRGAPRGIQHAAARLLPPEPGPAARLQPRVPAPSPPADAHRTLEAPARGVSA